MTHTVSVATCQVPEVREDCPTAISWMEQYCRRADSQGAKLVCFPECYLQGYLLHDATARRHAIALNSMEFEAVLKRFKGISSVVVFGMIEVAEGRLFNTAVVVREGRLIGRYRKTHILDGEALFSPGVEYPIFEVDRLRFGINICYDTNFPESARAVAAQGAHLLVCPSNNMMARDKSEYWKHRHNACRAQRDTREPSLGCFG